MKKRNLWIYIFGITIIIIGLIKLDTLISMVSILWNACRVLVFGAMMAFVINLVMSKIEKRLNFMKKGKRATSLLLSLILIFLFVYFLITLVVPSLSEAIGVIVAVLPKYFENTQKFMVNLFENNPQLAESINNLDINWKNLIQSGINVLSTGVTNVVGTTFNVVTIIVNSVFNFVLMFIFAIYVLLEKERFVQLYHRLTNLYLSETVKRRMDKCLNIINQTFSAFIGGQCIEATILGTLCTLGMIILRMPYPAMIGTLVGVINIIPMIGAYIGGAIGMFMVFTVSPIMSLWFLLYLCILQQIESNVIYPHVVGNSVGLPGIYVMMTVVIFGSLAGIPGMFLGIPTMASVYKIGVLYLNRKERLKEMSQSKARAEFVSRQYIHDLYRFFKLWSRRHEIHDIFEDTLDLWNKETLSQALLHKDYINKLADYLFTHDDLTEAGILYDKSIELYNRKNAELWQKAGFIYQKIGSYKKAIDYYLQSDLLIPDNTWNNRHLAQCYRKEGNYPKALEYYNKVEQAQPDSLNLALQIGQCLMTLERYDEALAYFFKVEYLDKKPQNARRAIGWCSFITGNHQQAKKYYDLLISEPKPIMEDWMNAGHVYYILNETEKSIEYYRKAQELCDSHDEFVRLYQIDKKDLIKQGANEVDLFILPDELI